MRDAKTLQRIAADRVQHLPAEQITCRYCGESSGSTPSLKGYVHKWGPVHGHLFTARKPEEQDIVGRLDRDALIRFPVKTNEQ